jgi:hypothetical protein
LKSIVSDQFCASVDFTIDGSCDANTYIWIKDVDPYVYLESGRATLPKSAFLSDLLELTETTNDIYEP